MASFIIGNYYKNSDREVIIFITARTKCFVSYKEFWISDLGKSYAEGKVKVRLNNDNDEYILVDRFSEYKSSNNYEYAEVKEEEAKFDEIKNFAEVSGYDLITEKEYAFLSDYNLGKEREEERNFRLCSLSGKGQFVKLNDVVEVIKNGQLLNGEFCPLPFSMTEDEVREYVKEVGYNFFSWHGGFLLGNKENKEKYYYTLADVVDAVREGELLNGDSCDLPEEPEEEEIKKIRPLNFKEIKRLAGNNGYELEALYGMFRLIKSKTRIVEYRSVRVSSSGYTADNYPTTLDEIDGDIQNHDFFNWEIDQDAPTGFLNCPKDGIVIREADTETRFVCVFE